MMITCDTSSLARQSVTGASSDPPPASVPHGTKIRTGERSLVRATTAHDEAVAEIVGSGMNGTGQQVAFEVLKHLRCQASLDELVVAAEDGGLTMEFTNRSNGRELLVVISKSGTPQFFLARCPDGFRKAGLVTDRVGTIGLGQWVASSAPFSSAGLVIG